MKIWLYYDKRAQEMKYHKKVLITTLLCFVEHVEKTDQFLNVFFAQYVLKIDKIAMRSHVSPAAAETRCDGHETEVFSMV